MKPAALKKWLRMAGMLAALAVSTASHADKIYFVHNDHLGTPQVITDENKNVVWEVDRDPWGNITNVLVDDLPNNVSLSGQYDDAETSYSDNWHRTYDKQLGQYLQFDPIGLAGGINPYLYANGDPIQFFDYDGLCPATFTTSFVQPYNPGYQKHPRTGYTLKSETRVSFTGVLINGDDCAIDPECEKEKEWVSCIYSVIVKTTHSSNNRMWSEPSQSNPSTFTLEYNCKTGEWRKPND